MAAGLSAFYGAVALADGAAFPLLGGCVALPLCGGAVAVALALHHVAAREHEAEGEGKDGEVLFQCFHVSCFFSFDPPGRRWFIFRCTKIVNRQKICRFVFYRGGMLYGVGQVSAIGAVEAFLLNSGAN